MMPTCTFSICNSDIDRALEPHLITAYGPDFKTCHWFYEQCMAIFELLFCWQMSLIDFFFHLFFTCYSRSLNWYMIYINVSMYVYVRMHTGVRTYFTRREGFKKWELIFLAVWPYGLCLKFSYTHFLHWLRLYTTRVFCYHRYFAV